MAENRFGKLYYNRFAVTASKYTPGPKYTPWAAAAPTGPVPFDGGGIAIRQNRKTIVSEQNRKPPRYVLFIFMVNDVLVQISADEPAGSGY